MGLNPAAVIALGFVLAQSVQTQDCGQTPTQPSSDVVTTADGARVQVQTIVTNLEVPWSMAFAPDGRLFVTERPGRVRIVSVPGASSELALALDDAFTQGEAGVLGLALDPDFASSRFVYVYYTARAGNGAVNRVVRYREAGSRLGEHVVLIDNIPAATIHDGGRIRFGPDGLLYISTGDANSMPLAQSLGSLAGKLLRINRDGTTPGANPFGSPVYSYGHRNPQGFDWHPTTGELWASEHGPTGNDEINVIRAGANFGWPVIQAGQTMTGMVTPITFYETAIAPSGASFARGRGVPQFENDLFVGALRGTHLLRLRIDPTSPGRIAAQERLLDGRFGRIRDVVSGPDGYVYFATNNRDGRGTPGSTDDRIARLVPAQ
jgi:glucose/arabinose dehydrogenase